MSRSKSISLLFVTSCALLRAPGSSASGAPVKLAPVVRAVASAPSAGPTATANALVLATPWTVDGNVDPTNAPVVAGDFQSLAASISPKDAQRLFVDDASRLATGAGVVVAILDAGFDLVHPAIGTRLASWRYDSYAGDGDPNDRGNGRDDDGDGVADLGVGHGNFVASIVARVAPDARLVAVRIADDEGRGTEASFASGMRYALSTGASVINLSFELDASNSIVQYWLDAAESRGVVVVCAAGNSGVESNDVVAKSPTSLTVGAVNASDVRAPFSNYGQAVSIYAPGVDIVGAYGAPSRRSIAIWSGTSFAAGWVSGAAALVRQRHPDWSPAQIRATLRSSVVPARAPSGEVMSAGRLNVAMAVQR